MYVNDQSSLKVEPVLALKRAKTRAQTGFYRTVWTPYPLALEANKI